MRRAIAFAFTILAFVGVQAPADARPAAEPLVPGLPVYFALGDSVTAGQDSAPDPLDWRASGYAGQVFDALVDDLDCLPAASAKAADGCRQLQYLNIARPALPGLPAVTSTVLVAEQLPVAVNLLRARNQNANPRDDVEVITMSVGGNDLLTPLRDQCVLASPPTGCAAAVARVLGTYAVNLETILSTLRAKAGDEAAIVMLTQYNPIPFCPLGDIAGASMFAHIVLEGGTVPGLATVPTGLNDIIRSTAARHDIRVADTFGRLQGPELVPPGDCRHPNLAGHRVIASVVTDTFTG
jgi:lysophospholipase L1-like esterase